MLKGWQVVLRTLLIGALAIAVSACVSNTLSVDGSDTPQSSLAPVTQTQALSSTTPVDLTAPGQSGSLPPSAEPGQSLAETQSSAPPPATTVDTGNPADGQLGDRAAARQASISQIRAKAQNGSGEKTQIGAVPQAATTQMTPQQRQELIRSLQQKQAQEAALISEGEAAAKREAARRLQARGARHYNDALKKIESE